MSALARALDPAERAAFSLARLVAAEQAPYFMHALFAASPVASPGLGTFAVDAAWRLYLDPELLTGGCRWEPATAAAVLQHEVGHLIRNHAARAGQLPAPLDHLGWNLASDAEINDGLLAAGVPLPAGVVTPASIGCTDGDLAERYYAALVTPGEDGDLRRLAGLDDGGVGCGSGAGGPAVPGELPPDVSLDQGDAEPVSAAGAELVRRRVARAVLEHVQAKGRGSVPSDLQRWACGVLAPPTLPWGRLLRAAIRRAMADQAGRVDYSYRRPSRRPVPGIITPCMRGPALTVAVVIDTSASMLEPDLDAALAEVGGVVAAAGVARDRVSLLSCDAAATTTATRVRSLADVRLTGGGGTDMRVGIAAAERLRPAPHVVIVLTDGYTPWPQTPTRARLICVLIGQTPPLTDTPPWATTVAVPQGAGTAPARAA